MIDQNNKNVKNQELDEYIKELIIARINAISKDLEISNEFTLLTEKI